MEAKFIEALRNYSILLGRVMEKSIFIHEYFKKPVYCNEQYSNMYWDKMNKNIVDLLKHCEKQSGWWRKRKADDKSLLVVRDCLNAGEVFVENGYLGSVSGTPASRD